MALTDSPLVHRLASLPSLSLIPPAQLEWLAEHGELKRFDRDDVLYSTSSPPPGCYVVLSGHLAVRATRDGMARRVNELSPGDISGRLPYSRMPRSSDDAPRAMAQLSTVADEPTEILLIAGSHLREMARECYDFTALCVHQMVDRTRLFKSDDLQREKMASLGRLAAGLAHELNNPSSAAARSAKVLDACRREVVATTRALHAARLTDERLALVEALEARAVTIPAGRSPLDDADREDEVLEWLEARGIDARLAEPLARASVTVHDLDDMAAELPAESVSPAVRYLAANAMASQLTKEIEQATQRIDQLVAAVKRHTQMDRAPVVDGVDVESTLADTLALTQAKARAKAVVLALHSEPDLPALRGVAGQLNDVWMNLLDNAVEAAPAGGRVTVSARREADAIVVCVTDNGCGIPAEDQTRVFEPFFTTRPVGQGAGLGLDVVQRVIRSHGGSVELNSRPGRTEFRVILPVTPPSRA